MRVTSTGFDLGPLLAMGEYVRVTGSKYRNKKDFMKWSRRMYAVKISGIFALERPHRLEEFYTRSTKMANRL